MEKKKIEEELEEDLSLAPVSEDVVEEEEEVVKAE